VESERPAFCWSWFGLHVTGLAQADQIFSSVGFVCGGELPEGLDVVDGQAVSDELTTVRTFSHLFLDDDQTDGRPIFTSKRLLATDIERRLWSGFIQTPVLASTMDRAEVTGAPALVQLPSGSHERAPAVLAGQGDWSAHPPVVVRSAPYGRAGRMCALPSCGCAGARARRAPLADLIRLDREWGLALGALHRYHGWSIAFLGSGTTAAAAYLLGRPFFGYDINERQVASARRRIAAMAR